MPNTKSLAKKLWQNKPNLVAVVAAVGVAFWLLFMIYGRLAFVKSSNAFVQADYTNLSAQVGGMVTRVYANSGQSVKQGQLLCELDAKPLESQLSEAEQNFAAVEFQSKLTLVNYARAHQLFKEKVISPSEYQKSLHANEEAQSKLAAASAAIEKARLQLSYTKIYAPADGHLAYRNAQPGLRFSPGAPLFGFVSDKERWVVAKVRETDIENVKIGSEVQIKIDAYPDRRFKGHVESIASASEVPFAAVAPVFEQGNFKKYVQWVSLRISLDLPAGEQIKIPVGLTTEIKMRRHG